MSKKDNFSKAVFDVFGVGTTQTTAQAEEKTASAAEQAISTDVQQTEVATPVVHAAPYALVPSTFLAPGTVLEGKLKSKGDVEIAGSFTGEIECDSSVTLRADATCNLSAANLTVTGCRLKGDCTVSGGVSISENSAIIGNITADDLVCSGAIEGDISVKGALALESTARIVGNIAAGAMSMARGAIIKGTISMGQD